MLTFKCELAALRTAIKTFYAVRMVYMIATWETLKSSRRPMLRINNIIEDKLFALSANMVRHILLDKLITVWKVIYFCIQPHPSPLHNRYTLLTQ